MDKCCILYRHDISACMPIGYTIVPGITRCVVHSCRIESPPTLKRMRIYIYIYIYIYSADRIYGNCIITVYIMIIQFVRHAYLRYSLSNKSLYILPVVRLTIVNLTD